MKLRHLLLSALAATTLSSCTTVPQTLTSESLLSQGYSLRTGQAFDVAAFFDPLPDWVTVTFADSSFDSATGAMIVRDLLISPAQVPEIGLRIDRADIWGGSPDAFNAIMSGNSLDTMGEVFDRISFQGIRSVGLQSPEGGESASLTIDKMVFDGLTAKSFALAPVENGNEASEFFRTFAALATSYAMDGSALSNLQFTANDNNGSEFSLSVLESFVRGYDRGATDYQRMNGLTFSSTSPNGNLLTEIAQRIEKNISEQRPEDKILQPWVREEIDRAFENPIAYIAFNSGAHIETSEIDFMEIRNSDISGGLQWLEKWEVPPISETNLIDLGSVVVEGNRTSWNGVPVYTIDRTEVTASDFYWLVPSKLKQIDTGIYVNVMEIVNQSSQRANFGVTPETGSQELQQIRQVISALGMETIRADSVASWNWNGETGALNAGGNLNLVDLASTSTGIDMGGPSLIEWDQLVSSGAAQDVIQDRISLGGFNFTITDDQLLDRVFDVAAIQMGAGSGDDVRQSVPALLRLSGGQVAALNPRIPSYIDAVANFLGGSGTLSLNVAPAQAVSLKAIQETAEGAPQTLPDLLNMTIDHTP